jgi:hypothetical protein
LLVRAIEITMIIITGGAIATNEVIISGCIYKQFSSRPTKWAILRFVAVCYGRYCAGTTQYLGLKMATIIAVTSNIFNYGYKAFSRPDTEYLPNNFVGAMNIFSKYPTTPLAL